MMRPMSAPPRTPDADDGSSPSTGRPFLGVMFDCCRVYARVYLNTAGDAYVGGCPRCGRPLRFRVGAGGSGERFWRSG